MIYYVVADTSQSYELSADFSKKSWLDFVLFNSLVGVAWYLEQLVSF